MVLADAQARIESSTPPAGTERTSMFGSVEVCKQCQNPMFNIFFPSPITTTTTTTTTTLEPLEKTIFESSVMTFGRIWTKPMMSIYFYKWLVR